MIFRREVITNNGGKGGDNRGNRRRSFKRRGHGGQDGKQNRNDQLKEFKVPSFVRPKWIPPQISAEPLPAPECPCCGKPIRDIASALSDRGTGEAVHFDCIISRISQEEVLDKGDFVSYIGGGRFGIVRFNNPGDGKKFTIKKILEWENKEDRPEWRSSVSDRYSLT